MSDYSSIQNDFLDGINEVFSIMFTNRVLFSFMDETFTDTNVYGETTHKFYKPPIALVGNVKVYAEKPDHPVAEFKETTVITIPTKQLILNHIPHGENDLPTLRKAKIEFNDVTYLVDSVHPKTLVADIWQFYEFRCSVEKKTSLIRGEYY